MRGASSLGSVSLSTTTQSGSRRTDRKSVVVLFSSGPAEGLVR